MLVTVGIRKLAEGRIRIEVQRPQHPARAGKGYPSQQHARRALLEFGISSDAIEALLKLLPDIAENAILKFPPLDIPLHQLTEEGLAIEGR
jgi:hypothetical protein